MVRNGLEWSGMVQKVPGGNILQNSTSGSLQESPEGSIFEYSTLGGLLMTSLTSSTTSQMVPEVPYLNIDI